MLEQFEKTGEEALAELQKVTDIAALEDFRIKYLGRKGQVTQMLSQIGKFPPEEKPKAASLPTRLKKMSPGRSKRRKTLFSRSKPGQRI